MPNDNRSKAASRFESVGNAHQLSGRFHQARRSYERWYSLTKNLEAALRLGDVCRQVEDFKSALHWYVLAGKLAEKFKLSQEKMDAKLGEAMCIRGLGRYEEAIRRLKTCLALYSKNRDKEAVAYTLWALGTTQRFAKKLPEAEKNLRRSIPLYQALRDESGLAYARAGLGGTLRMLGKPKESFLLYKKAHQFFVKDGDRFGEAYSSCGQGNALRMQGKVQAGLPFMNKAIQIYRSLKLRGPLGFVLWSRSQAHIYMGKLENGAKDLALARQEFRSVGDKRGLEYCVLGERQLQTQKKPCKIIQIP